MPDATQEPAPQEPEPAASLSLDPSRLAASLERESAAFFRRRGTIARGTLEREFRGTARIRVVPGSAECRPGAETPAVTDAERFPYACILGANSDVEGISTEVTLGFVITKVEGRCWTAQNERIAGSGLRPVLYPRDQALSPVNRVEGCLA